MSRKIRNGFGLSTIAAVTLALGGCGGGGGGGGSSGSSSATATAETVLHSFALSGDGNSPAPYSSLVQAKDGNLYGMTNGGGANSNGAVFEITTSGTENLLYSFGASLTDAAYPWSSLIQATDGNLYGMTTAGGTNGTGAVFKLTTAGAESIVYSFGATTGDGSTPWGGLIQATDGNLYGVTYVGGTNNKGAVFKITMTGTPTESVLYSFGATATDGVWPIGSLIQATDGNLYGMTNTGGTYGKGVVFKITMTSTPTETVLWSFGGAGDGTLPLGSLIQASDSNLYGMTQSGGANNMGTVFKITTTGTETVLHSFAGGAGDGNKPLGSLIQGSDGNLYGVTEWGGANGLIAGPGYGTAFKITTSGAMTLLYSFGATATDGSGPIGSLIQASDGHFYGMTFQGGTYAVGTVFRIN